MAISDCKVSGVPAGAQASNFTMDKMGNRFQPDVPNLPADEMKAVMDELSTNVLAPAHNKLVTELAPLESSGMLTQLNGHNVVTTAVGADGGDIPTLSALNDLGGGDMSTAVYCTGDPDNVDTVDHALFADDANALSGHADSYFATANDLTGVAQRVGVLENERMYVDGNTITLENICCAGVVDNYKKRVRFSIALDKPIDTTDGTHASVTSSGDIYVYGGASQTVIYSGPLSGLGVGGAANSGHMITYSATRPTEYGSINGCPVTVYGTFVISITKLYN
jgi:hypothetical protein